MQFSRGAHRHVAIPGDAKLLEDESARRPFPEAAVAESLDGAPVHAVAIDIAEPGHDVEVHDKRISLESSEVLARHEVRRGDERRLGSPVRFRLLTSYAA